MLTSDDPFEVVRPQAEDEFCTLTRRPTSSAADALAAPVSSPSAVTARLHGFDLEERPLLARVPGVAGEVVPARSTVSLTCDHIGREVVVVFDGGDPRRPIVLGVLDQQRLDASSAPRPDSSVVVEREDDRVLLSAEREITLRCGDASITLTRAGKVIIKGAYIVSHSSGHHRIKGAVVDIN